MTDPLAQLRDIHLPESTGFWPLAWGWWLLLAVILCAILAGIYTFVQQRRKNRYRLQAAEELDRALQEYRRHEDAARYLQDVAIILRRTALAAFPEPGVAGMRGTDWLMFLDATLVNNTHEFTQGVGRALLQGPYQPKPQVDVEALHQLAQQWVKEHKRTSPAGKAPGLLEGANA
ncbi:DUF4381 domain-containing protein [Marinimicrobium sp. ABcell2]|uniref:DUF4381 domain-containing protein n=1 Tax=Marinimicrobium sp. ABcell2 TaxID=3069751 RepID=UPI0027B2A287|nr:DUF4381 domain-containing protein [Marinimicrobium sp. ABcell2]MDQ2075620.1 DUF4381 domain-containing protein [Marinimicrobium sp. ABcell2]